MKLSKDNIDAIVSSLFVGLAWGAFWAVVVALSPTSTASPWAVGLVAFIIGLLTGLLTTWDVEDVADSNADV